MTNIPDEQILEFCRAAEESKMVYGWNNNISEAETGVALCVYPKSRAPFSLRVGIHCTHNFKHFSLTKPQVYEDGKWYEATIDTYNFANFRKGLKIICLYKHNLFLTVNNINNTSSFHEHCLTNIRPIPKELWEGE